MDTNEELQKQNTKLRGLLDDVGDFLRCIETGNQGRQIEILRQRRPDLVESFRREVCRSS